MAVQPIPEGYPRVTPYLNIAGAADAIDFYCKVLGATERMRMPGDSPDNIGHAELEIGTGLVMLADEFPDMGFVSPLSIGGTPVTIHVYVDDVDAVYARALADGYEIVHPLTDEEWGVRRFFVRTPQGVVVNVLAHA